MVREQLLPSGTHGLWGADPGVQRRLGFVVGDSVGECIEEVIEGRGGQEVVMPGG